LRDNVYAEMTKRDYPERPIVGVGAVVVDGDRALIVRRATEPLKGQWSIPGGMLELGEKLRDGLAREVQEETGLEVKVGDVLDVFDSIFPDAEGRTQYHYVLIDYRCTVVSGTAVAGSDVSEVRWVTSAELERLGMKQVTIAVIRKALKFTQQNKRPAV
jgi:8-oxo-dGTP diphosphatase